jgi:Plavaka transposase
VAERRQRRDRILPKRYRDILPEPLPLLPPNQQTSCEQDTAPPPPISQRILRIFKTTLNRFGLYRVYHSDTLPAHDPEEHLNVQDLFEQSDSTENPPPQPTFGMDEPSFHPYPNKSAFLLGDWYWNHGAQKSQESFQELVKVITDPEFSPGDVRHTRWRKIDAQLGINNFDRDGGGDDEENMEWLDDDAGWQKKPINISVPFHSRSPKPGPQNFYVGDLYYRPLVAVIREKLANSHDAQHFHYEPFELFWQPTHTGPDVRVHGELYTSPAFVDAHRTLLESPGEPGCDLPRVIVAMMFWSDVTHLTNFGTAKLWPCYLFFGNESKYRRCKPTCKLCNHVAYFQGVRG